MPGLDFVSRGQKLAIYFGQRRVGHTFRARRFQSDAGSERNSSTQTTDKGSAFHDENYIALHATESAGSFDPRQCRLSLPSKHSAPCHKSRNRSLGRVASRLSGRLRWIAKFAPTTDPASLVPEAL